MNTSDNWNPRSDGRPVVLHLIDSLRSGGTERAMVALLERLDHDRLRHVVVTMREAGVLAETLPERVACGALEFHAQARWAFLKLAHVARLWGASVIHARNTGCWLDAILAGKLTRNANILLGFHGHDTSAVLDPRRRRVGRWGYRLGAMFTSVSRSGVEVLHDQTGVARSAVIVLPNGVDTVRYAPPDTRAREQARMALGLPREAVVIGAVASLTPIKRLDLLIDAFASTVCACCRAELVLIGDGLLRDALRERARSRGLEHRVRFLGQRDDVAGCLAAMDVYVCSSDAEGVSNAMLEAMACGVPVVTSKVGDHGAIVRNGVEGVVVPPGDVRELSDALSVLCRSVDLRRRMGQAARRRSAAFTLEGMTERYEALYARLSGETGISSSRGNAPIQPAPLYPQACT